MPASKTRWLNPLSFRPLPVTILITLVYVALVVPLLFIQHVVPSPPKSVPAGLNITEAWEDLQHLTSGYHPYNSRKNDEVREWLLSRVQSIVAENSQKVNGSGMPDVVLFNDNLSNLTFASGGGALGTSAGTGVYYEGTNIIVYVRGSEDDPTDWWKQPNAGPSGSAGVLVNSHYDSVSTGFGATDDGVAVITLLQLLRYFTYPGHIPRRGLVLLFNNGEEDYLNGARAYGQHRISRFTHTFVNLEGAGAGGRAALFRTTDTEVTRFYKRAKHPFGSVFAADGFKLRYIRSDTDYTVFNGVLGLRGLDIAFMEPRAKYHTGQDDTKHTSVNSIWHMLSAAVATTEGLTSYTGTEFDSNNTTQASTTVAGTGTTGVWFDLFGSAFVVFKLHTLFALSVTLLVLCPIILLTTGAALVKSDRMYLFSKNKLVVETDQKVPLGGLRGLFRTPIIFVVTSAITVGLAALLTKVNPFIVHSSQYAVWSMMVSGWFFFAWFFSRVGDFARPSALHRSYALTWVFIVSWVLLVVAATYEQQRKIAGAYFILFYFAGVFLATWISYLELFALPRKIEYAWSVRQPGRSSSTLRQNILTPTPDELPSGSNTSANSDTGEADDENEAASESTSLLRNHQRTTFANYTRTAAEFQGSEDRHQATDLGVYPREQAWSGKLPTWTWVFQFLLVAPLSVALIGQLALFITAAMHQVGSDGISVFIIYIGIAMFTILLFTPLLPFIHRFTYHVPTFFFLVFVGTLIYNLVAFPFSSTSRLKLSFLQQMNLESGHNQVSLRGIFPYVSEVSASIPSVSGKGATCNPTGLGDVYECSWEGIQPQVVADEPSNQTALANKMTLDWISFNVSRLEGTKNWTRFEVSGRNTRACRLDFDRPVTHYAVHDSALDDRMGHILPGGVSEIQLWSRTWNKIWIIDVESPVDSGALTGRIVCLWSDYNKHSAIPALHEIKQYAPVWVAITKMKDGLVEASRRFSI